MNCCLFITACHCEIRWDAGEGAKHLAWQPIIYKISLSKYLLTDSHSLKDKSTVRNGSRLNDTPHPISEV
jgi:hypothetical protein